MSKGRREKRESVAKAAMEVQWTGLVEEEQNERQDSSDGGEERGLQPQSQPAERRRMNDERCGVSSSDTYVTHLPTQSSNSAVKREKSLHCPYLLGRRVRRGEVR